MLDQGKSGIDQPKTVRDLLGVDELTQEENNWKTTSELIISIGVNFIYLFLSIILGVRE